MLGVLANALAIVAGALVGLILRKLITENLSRTIQIVVGYSILVLGIKMALKFEHVIVMLGCLVAGGALGHFLQIEERVNRGALKLQRLLLGEKPSQFAAGFSMSSILFCTGAMAVVGSINSGLSGNHEVLFAKSLLDGVTNAIFATIYGVGVAFSVIPVFLYQGGIALLASKVSALSRPEVVNDISGVGGVLVMMLGVNIAGLAKVAVSDYLPAVVLVMAASPLALIH